MALTRQQEIVLATKIVQFMGKHGCNQQQFADLCGLSRGTINRFLNRRYYGSMTRTTLAKIMMTLNEGSRYFKVEED